MSHCCGGVPKESGAVFTTSGISHRKDETTFVNAEDLAKVVHILGDFLDRMLLGESGAVAQELSRIAALLKEGSDAGYFHGLTLGSEQNPYTFEQISQKMEKAAEVVAILQDLSDTAEAVSFAGFLTASANRLSRIKERNSGELPRVTRTRGVLMMQ